MPSNRTSILWAVLAAAFYALNAPLSKWLLADIPPTMMAALLYLGAGTGMAAVRLIQRRTGTRPHEAPLTRQDLPYTVGMVVLDIALLQGERLTDGLAALGALALGFVAYGLSIFFYIYAQRGLGAAKTSAYYAVAPFLGAGLSLAIFRQAPSPIFLVALLLMAAGAWLATVDSPPAESSSS
ncbi:MAG TPA: DMT family transporter [Subdoligranulum variabile]|uniref:DMT family transporter n=1 Tax=Subdoligranulum variabile TaxID=214851 RepID=A0A921IPE3_9FIRM|nr:DMT family transporter [Subdoligranulum variabile]